MDNNYKYKISVIMPLYNVAEYVEEAIDSVIGQTLGFRENIQLILVNDGSTDDVDKICQKYKVLYPENIIYFEQTNKGVSVARNEGLNFVKGKYISFFDGDDIWEANAFSLMYDFIEKNYDKIDFVAARYCFFGKKEGFSHPLDYKFNDTRIIDINTDYNCVQLSAATTLIKASVMDALKFDHKLKYSEDSVLMTQLLLDKMAYGVVKEAVYYYRKRDDENSAIDMASKSFEWYFDTPKYCYKKLFDESSKKYGEIIHYIQYLVMYDLQWRLNSLTPEYFTKEEQKEYESLIKALLKDIDDKIIVEQRNINIAYKLFALSLKHEIRIEKKLSINDSKVFFNDIYLFSLRNKNRLRITNLQIRGNNMYIQGFTQVHILGEDYLLIIRDSDGREIPIEFFDVKQRDMYGFNGDRVFKGIGFRVRIELTGIKWIGFYLKNLDGSETILSPSFGQFAKINNNQKSSYYAHGDFIIKYGSYRINIIKKTTTAIILAELKYLKNTIFPKHEFKLAFLRIVSYMSRMFFKKPIWIVSDRTDMARDNGEALFSYLVKQNKDNQRKIFFALDKNSVDFTRMKKIGNVLKLDSLKYKLCFLQADKIISAHADDWVINAFREHQSIMGNLYDFDYIFLQHGIIKDDLSRWLHKANKNINLFVTSAKREYNSIIEGDYGYTAEEVKLTGLPRYDKLESASKNIIVFLPTWRKNIAMPTEEGSSVRKYSDTFKFTEYFNFYNSLINDERLLSVMKTYGFQGEFYLHPAFFSQINDFTGNEIIKVIDKEADYQRVFRENALMITDFSSVAFDFAYMKKPVIYCQFDYNSFFESHSYTKGYYDYETDGFGPVCYTYRDTVDSIIKCIEDGCMLDPLYEKRINDFFAWKDKNNCERVYQEIQNLY